MHQQESLIQEGVMTLNQLLNMAWGWKTKSQDELEFEEEVNQMKLSLIDCPVCGNKMVSDDSIYMENTTEGHDVYNMYRICCSHCGITTSKRYFNELDAMKAWNELGEKKK